MRWEYKRWYALSLIGLSNIGAAEVYKQIICNRRVGEIKWHFRQNRGRASRQIFLSGPSISHFNYILCVIDVFSIFAWARAIKKKELMTVTKLLKTSLNHRVEFLKKFTSTVEMNSKESVDDICILLK